jgi:PAS domain-containing protein
MSAESSFSPFVSLPREMLDRIDEGLCAVDRNLRITYLNTSAERICNIRRGELVGCRPQEASLEFFGVLTQELELSLCNGSVRHVDLPLSLQGSCIKLDIYPYREGLWLILRDLSSRQAIEQQLRERDEILTMAEQSAGIGVWDIDLATRTVRGTRQFWR